MQAVMIVTVIFSAIVLGLAVIGGTFLLAVKILKGGVSSRDRNLQAEEARMIQEVYHSLSNMEKRVETLETILMEHYGKDRT